MLVGHVLRVENLLRLHGTADLRQRYFVQGGRTHLPGKVLLLQVEDGAWHVAVAGHVGSTAELGLLRQVDIGRNVVLLLLLQAGCLALGQVAGLAARVLTDHRATTA